MNICDTLLFREPVYIISDTSSHLMAQGTAVRDMLYAARIIIGTESKLAVEKLKKIYEPFGIPIVSVSVLFGWQIVKQ